MARTRRPLNSEVKADQSAKPRELTSLEYVILGFLAVEPRSGYTIMTALESGIYRASASTGSIYPLLKRLETAALIASTLEVVHEMRPRKVYRLLPQGEAILDEWLRQPPSISEVIEEYDIALHKFLAAEFRLTRAEVLAWLNEYESVAQTSLALRSAIDRATRSLLQTSVHAELVNQSLVMETEARLAWVRAARARLEAEQQ